MLHASFITIAWYLSLSITCSNSFQPRTSVVFLVSTDSWAGAETTATVLTYKVLHITVHRHHVAFESITALESQVAFITWKWPYLGNKINIKYEFSMLILPLNDPSCASPAVVSIWIAFHRCGNCTPFCHCEFFCGQSYFASVQNLYHRCHIPMVSLLYELFCAAPVGFYLQTLFKRVYH